MNKQTRRRVAAFSLASLLNDVGADMIKPLWPIFITSSLGAPAVFLGLLDGLGQLVSYLTRFPFGLYADRWKRKPFVVTGYLFAGISRVGYAFSGTPAGAFFSHIIDRTGKGMRDAPRDALLASGTIRRERGRAFGTLRAMDYLGGTIGPLLAYLLISFMSFRTMFLLAAIPSLIGAIMITFMIKEKFHDGVSSAAFRWRELTKEYKTVFWISGLFALSWFSISFMLLYATTHGVPTEQTPLLYLTYSLTAACMAYPAGRLSDAIGRKTVLLAGYTMFGITMAAFTLVASPDMFFLMFFLYGLHYGVIEALQSSYISDMVKEDHRASAIGLFQGLWGICLLPASLIAGFLWDNVAQWAPFLYSAVVATISVLLFAYKVPQR